MTVYLKLATLVLLVESSDFQGVGLRPLSPDLKCNWLVRPEQGISKSDRRIGLSSCDSRLDGRVESCQSVYSLTAMSRY